MERVSVLGALRDGRDASLPLALLQNRGVGAWRLAKKEQPPAFLWLQEAEI